MNGVAQFLGGGDQDGGAEDVLTRAVRAVRSHLDMDIGVLSEFVGDRYVLRALDAPAHGDTYKVGDAFPLEINYCPHVIAGDLPNIIEDARDFDLATSLPITDIVGIRSYVGLPVRREDGSVYGMFCCISHVPKPGLNERDLNTMRLFADLSSREVHRSLRETEATAAVNARIDAALAPGGLTAHFQPILHIAERRIMGVEALSRFTPEPHASPDVWFAEAALTGRQVELEVAAIRTALQTLGDRPAI